MSVQLTPEEQKQALQVLLNRLEKEQETLQFPSFNHTDAFNIGLLIRDLFLSLSVPPGKDGSLPPPSNAVYRKEINGQAEDLSKRGIVIHIETFTGHRLFSAVVGNPTAVKPDNWIWVQGKINIVKRFHRSSYYVGRKAVQDGHASPEEAGYRLPEWAAHGGAFPIWIKGVTAAPVGVIVVSGLPQEMDHQLIVDVVRDYIPKMTHV